MICYECGQPAIGQCKKCGKFYCRDHGDVICQAYAEKPAPVPQEKHESLLRSCLTNLVVGTAPLWGPIVLFLLAGLAIWITQPFVSAVRERQRREARFEATTAAWGSVIGQERSVWDQNIVGIIELGHKYVLGEGIDDARNWDLRGVDREIRGKTLREYGGSFAEAVDLLLTPTGRKELEDLGSEHGSWTGYLEGMTNPETGLRPGHWTLEELVDFLAEKWGYDEKTKPYFKRLFLVMYYYFKDPESTREDMGTTLARELNHYIEATDLRLDFGHFW
jgi:hypothetical protein